MIRAFAQSLVVSLSILFHVSCTNAEYSEENINSQRIDDYIEHTLQFKGIPGASIAFVKDGEVIYSNSYGVKSIKQGTEVTPNTIFHLASISKTFVAVAVAQLLEENRIDLDDPVAKHLPYFKLQNNGSSEITIRHLLNHTSGIMESDGNWWENPETGSEALENHVKSLSQSSLGFKPGEQWSYSNIGYNVLGDLVSKVSGMPFEDYMRMRILDPLEMYQSTFFYDSVPTQIHASPHSGLFNLQVSEIVPYNRTYATSSTVQSNSVEMSKWIIALLDTTRSSLPHQKIQEQWIAGTDVVGTNGDVKMGLGWFVQEHSGNKVVGHGGRDPGFSSIMALVPEQRFGFIFMANNASAVSAGDQVSMIMDILDIASGEMVESSPISVSFPVSSVLEESGIDRAIEEYYQIKSEKTDNYNTGVGELTWLANDLYRQERYEEALQLYQVERREYSNLCHVCLMMAKSYAELDEIELATDLYKDWLEYLPDQRDEKLEAKLGL